MMEKEQAQKYFTAILRSPSMDVVIKEFGVSREKIMDLLYKYFPKVFHNNI